MAECDEISLMPGALADDELEAAARQRVESHLTGCATCVAQLTDYSTIQRELRKIVAVPQLEGFAKAVLEKIAKLIVIAFCALVLRGGIAHESAPSAGLVDVRVDSFVASDAYQPGESMIRHRHKQIKAIATLLIWLRPASRIRRGLNGTTRHPS